MATTHRAHRPAILIDIGGVLVPDYLTAAATAWGSRLGIAPHTFLAALFAGSDEHVLIGRASEAAWWTIVADRLRVGEDLVAEIRSDLAARHTWNTALLTHLRRLRDRATIAIVSNAWPDTRARIADAGLHDLADAVVLSCEVGYAKPDPRIYAIALHRVGADPTRALFIDDTPRHVDAARSLGMTGHVHTNTDETIDRIDNFVQPRSGWGVARVKPAAPGP
jgi:putative hydrolase of the HAD superfamily